MMPPLLQDFREVYHSVWSDIKGITAGTAQGSTWDGARKHMGSPSSHDDVTDHRRQRDLVQSTHG
ncbi:MAG: hypothetical protein DMF60_17800 [Acidobacteria bacterium]|nr:MAG: hypothetical protein DMF60_17800 [Acidobacteriota bacterium]